MSQPQRQASQNNQIQPKQSVEKQKQVKDENQQQPNSQKQSHQESTKQLLNQNKQPDKKQEIPPVQNANQLPKDKEKFEEQPQQIIIEVVEEIIKGNSIIKSYLYRIVGTDMHGRFQVIRKYSQFQALKNILLERWPACFVPSLNNQSQIKVGKENTEFKLRWLTHFLKCLSKQLFLYYKQELQVFLRSPPQIDIKQMYEKMPVLKVIDVSERFIGCFGQDIQKPPQVERQAFISNFITSLKKILNNLNNLSYDALILAQSYDNYSLKFNKFAEVIYNYEQFSLAEYTNMADKNQLLTSKQQQINIKKLNILFKKNPFYEIYQLLEIQAKDTQTFLDIILAMESFIEKRDYLERKSKQTQLQISQIALGHKSLKVFASRKTKQEIQAQLQNRFKQQVEDKINVSKLHNILSSVLSATSIKTYKEIKKYHYSEIIKLWIMNVNQINPELSQMWKIIQQDSQKLLKMVN